MVFYKDGETVAVSSTISQNSNKMDIGDTLRDALVEAREEGRITCGVYQSGEVLETDPDGVMMCILAMNTTDDVTVNIYLTLIDALCAENDIRVMKVDSVEKLAKLIGEIPPVKRPLPASGSDPNDNGLDWSGVPNTKDYNCVLIQYPSVEFSEVDADLLEYHKMTCEIYPTPVIELHI